MNTAPEAEHLRIIKVFIPFLRERWDDRPRHWLRKLIDYRRIEKCR